MAKINIRESLGKRDLSSNNKYDLRNTYDSLSLSESKKKQLAKALYENKSNKVIYSILNESLADGAEEKELFRLAARAYKQGETSFWKSLTDEQLNTLWSAIPKVLDINPYGTAWDDEVFDELTSRGLLSESQHSLNEDIAIKQFSKYSREYEKLERVATYLTAMSPNKYYYYVGDTYFDFGQDWRWTTVIAKKNRNGRWDEGYQALSPRAQEDVILAQSDEELEEIARRVLSSKYCPDRSEEQLDESIEDEILYKVILKYGPNEIDFEKGLSYEEAEQLADEWGWRWLDEQNYLWDMEIREDDSFSDNSKNEAFDADRVQKRIACTTEFDNGHVFHNDYFRASSAEAEEMARQKSIENPGKVFYVKYDDVMEPCSDIKWKNGQKIIEELTNSEDYKLGDIVTWHNDRYVIIDNENDDDLLVLRPLDKFQDSDFDDISSGDSCEDVFLSKYQLAKPLTPHLNEDIDIEDFDDGYDEDGVEEGNRFFADGKDYTWDERIAGPIHLDFDNWAVWSATESVNILDYATKKPDGGYEVDKDAFMKAYMDAPVVYFVVDEDTGFIDWGPCDTDIEAKDFLNSKQDDWENEV